MQGHNLELDLILESHGMIALTNHMNVYQTICTSTSMNKNFNSSLKLQAMP